MLKDILIGSPAPFTVGIIIILRFFDLLNVNDSTLHWRFCNDTAWLMISIFTCIFVYFVSYSRLVFVYVYVADIL